MSYCNNPVSQGENNSSPKLSGLVEALQLFPIDWVLTPVKDKAPKRPKWQTEKLNREQLIKELRTGKWTGYGLVMGELSGGLLAVDFDGPTAIEKWRELSGGSEPPVFETLGWTSGKEGRYQLLFFVPETEWTGLENRVAITSGEKEQLEIRWNASQSVLPPSSHPETEGYRWLNGEPDFTKIAECPKWVLSLLRKQMSQQTALNFSSGDIPLTAFLTLEDRALVDSGIGQGSRNTCGAKLARNLIGTAERLKYLGIQFSEEPHQLFEQFCQRCYPTPLGAIEADKIWISAERSNPTASLTDEALKNCAKAWLYKESRPQSDRNGTQKTPTVLTHPKFIPTPPIETLEGEIDKLIEADLRSSQLGAQILDLSQRYRQSANDIRKLFQQREEERELERSREDLASEIERLLTAQKSALDIDNILPAHLAKPIKLLSERQKLKPESYLLALLAQTNSLFKAGSKICDPFPETDWTEIVPTIFAALVAPPGAGKTPIAKSMILKPMSPLVEAAQAEYDAAQADYESELDKWKKEERGEKGPKPKQPAKRYYHFHSQSTLEGILLQLSKQPTDGAMLFADELEGYFSGQNQYKSGKGNDKSILLSLWSGVAPNGAMRKSDGGSEAYHLPNGCNLGIFGGIQPDVLAKILGDGGDPQGEFGRFLYVSQPLSVTNFTELIGKGRLELPLAEIYQRLDRLGSQNFYFSEQARRLFAHFHDTWCKPRILQENRPALVNYLKKLPEHAARIAMGLQALWQSEEIIEVEILKSAIAVATYSYHQLEALLMELKPSSRNLAPNLAKVLSLVQKKGEATARDICRSFSSRDRQSTSTVKQWLTELSAMGFLSVTTDGKYFPIQTDRQTNRPIPDTVSISTLSDVTDSRPTLTDSDTSLSVNVGHLSVIDRQTKNHTGQAFQPFVGHVGQFSDSSKKVQKAEAGCTPDGDESWQKTRMKPRDAEKSVNPWKAGDRARDLMDDRIRYVIALIDPLHVSVSSEPGGQEEEILHVEFLAPCSDDDDGIDF